MTNPQPKTQTEGFATIRTIVRRRQRELRRRMMGIKKGSGFALKGGQRVRLSPQQQVKLQRLGRQSARRTTHQLLMQRGQRRALSMLGRRTTPGKTKGKAMPAKKKGIASSVAFSNDYLDRVLHEAAEGRLDDALRLVLRDPAVAETPMWRLADRIYEELTADPSQNKSSQGHSFFDVEVVESEGEGMVFAYAGPGSNATTLLNLLQQYGEATIVASAGEPLSDSETSELHVVALKPSEASLTPFESVSTADVAGYNGAGEMPKMTGPGDVKSVEMPDDKAKAGTRKKDKKSEHPRNVTMISPPPE